MMPNGSLNPLRLPSLHMITALVEGEVPLGEALAGFFFCMMHDYFEHDCLMKSHPETVESPSQEWAYLPIDVAFIFIIMAKTATEETQRWIAFGKETPIEIPLGPLVQRPKWAIEPNGKKLPAYVQEAIKKPPAYVREAIALIAALQKGLKE